TAWGCARFKNSRTDTQQAVPAIALSRDNERYAKQGKFFADSEGIREAVQQLTGADFGDFFNDYVAGVREIPWMSFFTSVGLRVGAFDVSVANPTFKAVQKFSRTPVVVTVEPNGGAEQAGVKADDEIVSINGI